MPRMVASIAALPDALRSTYLQVLDTARARVAITGSGDTGDPARNAETAADHMRVAARLAAELGAELTEAQTAIADQGYRAAG